MKYADKILEGKPVLLEIKSSDDDAVKKARDILAHMELKINANMYVLQDNRMKLEVDVPTLDKKDRTRVITTLNDICTKLEGSVTT